MCVALLGRRHLVNAHKVNAGWLILFGYKTGFVLYRRYCGYEIDVRSLGYTIRR